MMAKIYKKNSRNGSIALYLGKRDFVDHVDSVDVVVWVSLTCAFRYGREDLDVIGLSFRKDIWVKHLQVYPATSEPKPANTPMQDALLRKVGGDGHAFTFIVPANLPCSVTLQPGPGDAGKACGVDFEVKAYIANDVENPNEQVDKSRSTADSRARKQSELHQQVAMLLQAAAGSSWAGLRPVERGLLIFSPYLKLCLGMLFKMQLIYVL
ncbi:hypothetical protein ACEWY4_026711 [Coilia grayii]|uniref:Arrestin-like N-terminal domain-containing protein n=1 Tax=Coilia grayii TaxID=363190 RepID=A0ABD1IQE2_9TELE